jgi:hypothetical protein
MADQDWRRRVQSQTAEVPVTGWPVRRSRSGRLTLKKILQVIQLFFAL